MTIYDLPMVLSLYPGLHATFYAAAMLLQADHRELDVPADSPLTPFTLWWLCGLGFSSASAFFGVLIFGLFGPTIYFIGLGLMYVIFPRIMPETAGPGAEAVRPPLLTTLRVCAMMTGLSIVMAIFCAIVFGSPLS
ncbi:hypothetical protein [Amaricoccus tamworthensis]|uniref:hypothetical protein n=1 Tax=Amaricoccus tamworthensis TaxID=57002 RepID=UPI003C7EA4AF